ncbi:MAG: OmpA family protein [Alphaproteobacteria bacterium]|nr:OmpA family protein [Alphaproteobacteria bacterium]
MNVVPRLIALLSTSELIDTFASMAGETATATRKGVAAAVASILGALIAKGSNESGASSLIRLMTEHKIDGNMLDQLALLFGGRTRDAQIDLGNRMLGAILDDKTLGVTRLVSSASEMSGASAGKLMALVAPTVLGGVATAAPAGGFSASTLAGILASQKDYLGTFAPPGLSDLLGLGVLGTAEAPAMAFAATLPTAGLRSREAGAVGVVAMAAPSFWQVLPPWVLLAALIILAFFGLRSCMLGTERAAVEATVVTEPEPVAPEVPAEPAATQLALPSGTVLTVPPGSVGENLYNFLIGTETGSKTFLFDGLTFESGSTTLDANSQSTIAVIAEILKEFGAVTVSVDGYTDNTGSREENARLSQARAQEVMAALTAAGIDASRLTSAGHADDSPVADNGTEEGRAQNRRTELTATKN